MDKEMKQMLKARAWMDIVWGLLMVFVIIGGVMGKTLALQLGIIIAVGWVWTRIVRGATDAIGTLRKLREEE